MTSETASACRFLRRACIRRTMPQDAGRVHSGLYATAAVTVEGAKREDDQIEMINAKKNEGEQKVGVGHFSHSEGNKFEIAGGIPSKLQNSGIGIYSCIAIVNQFFQERPDAIIISCASANNVRSFRLVTSIGFKLIKQDDRHFETFLTREMFHNDFTNSVKLRIGL